MNNQQSSTITQPKSVPQVLPGGVSVCAWCYPGTTVIEDYPWLGYLFAAGAGGMVTHGICEACNREMKQQVLEATLFPLPDNYPCKVV